MAFETKVVPWIDEIQNYLSDESKKPADLKKVLKSADLEKKLSYADRAKLYEMFDPKCEITEELLRRQLKLYFALIESKSPMKIPVFADYVDWIYSQDIEKINDKTFDILAFRVLKTSASDLSQPIRSFIDRLPKAFDNGIDKMSNARISTLILILRELDMPYESMPEECKTFVKELFKACAVKTEIADKNKSKMRVLFRDDPRYYYSIFNRAFSGVSEFDFWIEEPAKKLTLPNMVNYANFQSCVLANNKRPLNYANFASYAKGMKLPMFPSYDKHNALFDKFYLREPREYKDYAKKMGQIFVYMLRDEMDRVERLYDEHKLTPNDLRSFAITYQANSDVATINPYAFKKDFLSRYSKFLIDLVHLDDLTGQSLHNIYDANVHKQEVVTHVEPINITNKEAEIVRETTKFRELYGESAGHEIEGQFDMLGEGDDSLYYPTELLNDADLNSRIRARSCDVKDLPALYEVFEYQRRTGKQDEALVDMIVLLEEKLRDAREDEVGKKYE